MLGAPLRRGLAKCSPTEACQNIQRDEKRMVVVQFAAWGCHYEARSAMRKVQLRCWHAHHLHPAEWKKPASSRVHVSFLSATTAHVCVLRLDLKG